MAAVYVIQVMACHGVGLEGWRTVRQSSGLPYSFPTYDTAHVALQKHFSNMREGINVRVHAMELDVAAQPLAGVPLQPLPPDEQS